MTLGLKVDIKVKLGNFALTAKFQTSNEVIVLIGPSGSGKSTILSCIAGLQKPETGEIRLAEKILLDSEKQIFVPPHERHFAYLLQNNALFPHLNVAGNICYALSKQSKAQQAARLEELLTIFRIEDLRNFKVSQLSGGQAKRVALARALAAVPELVLLDEPFSALDEDLREELANELKSLQKQLNVPMVLVTHSKQEALFMADTLLRIEQGKIIASGSPEELLLDRSIEQTTDKMQFSW